MLAPIAVASLESLAPLAPLARWEFSLSHSWSSAWAKTVELRSSGALLGEFVSATQAHSAEQYIMSVERQAGVTHGGRACF